MAVKAIPDGYEGATPYIIVDRGAAALDFYQRAFGAKVTLRLDAPGGKIGHAEFAVGRAMVMLADEYPELGHRSPRALGGTPVSMMIYVEDCDALVRQAEQAGATIRQPLEDKFYGDRSATIEDPFGHVWTIATHKEDLSPEEMAARAKNAAGGG